MANDSTFESTSSVDHHSRLTVRNFCGNSFTVIHCERFGKASSDTVGWTSYFNSSSKRPPTSTELAAKATKFLSQDINVKIHAFTTVDTAIAAPSMVKNETIRLTVRCEEKKYRIEVPNHSDAHRRLISLSPGPSASFMVTYHVPTACFSVLPSAMLERWMGELPDLVILSALSIPGTHNSPACYKALPSVRCQSVPPQTQLEHGVRFFDVRVQVDYPKDPSNDSLTLVHSAFSISLRRRHYFRQLVDHIYKFLSDNPSESLILSLKREGSGSATDEQLSMVLKTHYVANSTRWYTEPRIPTLGEVRGKIILIRRFELDDSLMTENDGTGWGIDAEDWPDNAVHGLTPGGDICVQDFYQVMATKNISEKIEHIRSQLLCSSGSSSEVPQSSQKKMPLFLNFLNASNFWSKGCWPERIAAVVNPAVLEFLCTAFNQDFCNRGSTGIVICDWVGNAGNWDLVNCIVGMNTKLREDTKKQVNAMQSTGKI